jgi:hypothetical protein
MSSLRLNRTEIKCVTSTTFFYDILSQPQSKTGAGYADPLGINDNTQTRSVYAVKGRLTDKMLFLLADRPDTKFTFSTWRDEITHARSTFISL